MLFSIDWIVFFLVDLNMEEIDEFLSSDFNKHHSVLITIMSNDSKKKLHNPVFPTFLDSTMKILQWCLLILQFISLVGFHKKWFQIGCGWWFAQGYESCAYPLCFSQNYCYCMIWFIFTYRFFIVQLIVIFVLSKNSLLFRSLSGRFFINVFKNHSEYKKVFMEYPIEFKLLYKETESAIQTFSFNEYGVYTLHIESLDEPVLSLKNPSHRFLFKLMTKDMIITFHSISTFH